MPTLLLTLDDKIINYRGQIFYTFFDEFGEMASKAIVNEK
jgi:hypothetical protein